MNECDLGVCGVNEKCINEIGGYKCECETGYQYSIAEKMCVDVDECGSDVCDPDKVCENTVGSFICKCPEGLILKRMKKL